MGWAEMHTANVPKAERFGWWLDLLMQDLAPTHIASEHRDDFQGSTAALELGPVKVSVLSFPPLTSRRTARLIQRSDPELWELGYMASGIMVVDQARNHAQVGAGDLLLYDTSQPVQMQMPEGGWLTILHLPKPAVPLPDRSMRDLLSRRLPAQGTGSLLAGFLQGLAGGQWSDLEAERLGAAAVQLASAFLGGLADREGLLPPETRQSVLLRRVKAFIEAHLTEPRLSTQTIADAHNISVRYLHQLFRPEKQTVSAHIRELRLDRCRTDLAQPGYASHPIEAIGARWGFTDAAVFSRTFKAAFGMPPGEYRRRLGACSVTRHRPGRPQA
ncbi:helix-turn-helix domain-containing protein [Streptomyces violaceusniger]|uniref:helix-turn-helix domain-containing protein n=1 Tax=Streptomyces violaceusniger TaxID=68280 RepID=UPI0031D68C89